MTDVEKVQREIQLLESSADFLLAYDRARAAIESYPDEPEFKYFAVRSLARGGATHHALDLYGKYELGKHDRLDYLALRARLEKDLALRVSGPERSQRLRAAAKMYGDLFNRSGGYYAAVNTATLFLLAGDVDLARGYARETLAYCARDPEKTALDDYYRAASRAEAHLILGETLECMKALHTLASISRGDLAARAGTRRQLGLVLDALRLNRSILAPLTPPDVIHYTGERPASGARIPIPPAKAERALAGGIEAAIKQRNVGMAYGSLAGPADVLFAEECLRRNVELHLVLPWKAEVFRAAAAAAWPESWLARIDAILGRAASTMAAQEGDAAGDESLLAYCGEIAMGKAILRSQYIDGRVVQLAVRNSRLGQAASTPATDIARWRAGGRETVTIAAPEDTTVAAPQPASGDPGSAPRTLRALIFGDTVGFSRIPERQLPVYRATFMGAIADAVRSFGAGVLAANSWGDAVYLVMADAVQGARCALEIRRRVNGIDYRRLGFDQALQLRLSLHYGPVFAGADELTGGPAYYGSAVTFAARMEPVTPPGQVYATEALAAQLALAGEETITADYVGKVALAKQYGAAPMYLLRARAPA